ncbi:MAG TPA: ATPase [Cyanobacteria bacterium UBA11162]|nr:ATPase [Cyanobacteria bacterium UBA11162]
MNTTDVQSLVSLVDELIFSHTGEHLDDLQQAILEGAFDHQKYAEIAKNNHRSEKYVKDLAGKLWQTISAALGEEVSKSNIKSALQRYHYSNFSNVATDSVQINSGNICTKLPYNELKQAKVYQQAKLETVQELVKEGLSIEQIARVLKLPLELVQQQIQNFE